MPDPIPSLEAVLADRYRIERELGEGGMATVYLADDVRHGRKVALKVLKPELAAAVGAERFLAEIRTTASLQHSHILPLFDSGAAEDFLYYVMPYVEGESLADRLERERQLPVAEAARIAMQVAEALDHAHQQRVVHRDIKPANILLRGQDVFVADFGIALAVGASPARLTQTGMSVGTPRYMSPEQATGDSIVGAPSDVWALGCVLHEMLAGAPPFDGPSPQAILGRIVSGSLAPVTASRKSVPPHIAAAVAKALERVPADRFASAAEFARALADPRFRHGEETSPVGRAWKALAAGVALYALGVLTWWMLGARSAEAGEDPIRFIVTGPAAEATGRTLALSPDGALLVDRDGVSGRLELRRVGDFEGARDLAGLRDGVSPFFSPGGGEIAYFTGITQSLMRVPVAGGRPTVVVDGDGSRALGGSWGDDGTIVFATGNGVLRVSPDNGTPPDLLLASAREGGALYTWPNILPGSRAVLLTVVPASAATDTECSIVVLDLESGMLTEVLAGGSGARYSSTGHLLFSADGGTLYAIAFDPSTRRVRGERFALPVTGLALPRGWGADFDVAAGTLVYVPSDQPNGTLVWRGRDGSEEPLGAPDRGYNYPRISPVGKRVAVDFSAPGMRDVSVWDIESATLTPVANEPGEDWGAEWYAGGDSLYYASNRDGGTFQIYRRAADGSGNVERVFTHSGFQAPQDVTPDGARIIISESRPAPTDQFDIMALELGDSVRRVTVLSTAAVEYNPSLSADGRLIAYQTYEAGQAEVYVRPLDGAGSERVKVSVDGGERPVWSTAGDTVFYRSPADSMMAAAVVTQPRLGVRDTRALFAIGSQSPFGITTGRSWDVPPVDGRFLMVRRPPRQESGVRVVLNWTADLRRATMR